MLIGLGNSLWQSKDPLIKDALKRSVASEMDGREAYYGEKGGKV